MEMKQPPPPYQQDPGPPPHPQYPHPQYPHPQYQPGPTIITTQPTLYTTVVPGTVIVATPVGPQPARVFCKSCNSDIVTRIDSGPSVRTHLFALVLCLVGCWPCVCLPYCMDSCLKADHYCPNCNAFVGSYQS